MAVCPGADRKSRCLQVLPRLRQRHRGGGTSSQEERKVVSVLFVDLVGFTARSHHADPEDVRAPRRRIASMQRRLNARRAPLRHPPP